MLVLQSRGLAGMFRDLIAKGTLAVEAALTVDDLAETLMEVSREEQPGRPPSSPRRATAMRRARAR
ncbi:MAG: hypothetical protein HY217_05270 [Candidatus Rokubacteria bacterium]|nr:hypothetical protein [Candidatus Rokubacteria bacterium]